MAFLGGELTLFPEEEDKQDIPDALVEIAEDVQEKAVEPVVAPKARLRAKQALSALPHGTVTSVTFGVFSTEKIDRLSVLNITHSDMLRDPKLGPQGRSQPCETCGHTWDSCPGHVGSIVIPKMIHPLMRDQLILVLMSVCNDCGRLMTTKKELELAGILRFKGRERLKRVKEHIANAKKRCPRMFEDEAAAVQSERCRSHPIYLSSREHQKSPDLTYRYEKGGRTHPRTPEEIYDILAAIPNDDAQLMGFRTDLGQHPKNFIIERVVVVPYCVRPDPMIGDKTTVDDLTSTYKDILSKVNNYNNPRLTAAKRREAFVKLTAAVGAIMKNDGSYTQGKLKVFSDLSKLLNGKQGLPRLVMGKRVDFVGRTVAAPGPQLMVDEVGIPAQLCDRLTRPVKVTAFNVDELQQDLDNGKIQSLTMSRGPFEGTRWTVNDNFLKKHKNYRLQMGDVVDRRLKNGDYVMFNRGPTLHSGNLIALRVVVIEGESVAKANLSYTMPLNLDFDGDEVNFHVPQTIEAYADMARAMNVQNNLIDMSTGKAMIAITYDSLTGAYLMSHDDVKVTPELWETITAPVRDFPQMETLEARLEKYGIDKLSGKALVSATLPEGFFYSKTFTIGEGRRNHIEVRDGILISGVLTKKVLGTSHGGFIVEMRKQLEDYTQITDFMSNIQFVSNWYLKATGFTVHLGDCVPDSFSDKAVVLHEAFDQARSQVISLTKDRGIRRNLSREEEQIQEQIIVNTIESARNIRDKIIKDILVAEPRNNMLKMRESGAKGKLFNQTMIGAGIGQQTVQGRRPEPVFPGRRALPSIAPFDPQRGEAPETRGFCKNSFARGLDPDELFFHMMATRESLTNTAQSTADTGSLYRRVVKSVEGTHTTMGGHVLGSNHVLVQPVYGGDALHPGESEPVKVGSMKYHLPRDFPHLAEIISKKWEYIV